MTYDDLAREYVKFSVNLLPVLLKQRRPFDAPLNTDPDTIIRLLIEVQGAALAHILRKYEAENCEAFRKGLAEFQGKEPR